MKIDPGLAHQSGQVDLGLQGVEVVAGEVIHWNLQMLIRNSKSLTTLAEILEVPREKLLIGGAEGLASSLDLDDEELVEMITELPKLEAREIDALKVLLGSMLTRHRMAETLKGARP